jgi:hypothetical protein
MRLFCKAVFLFFLGVVSTPLIGQTITREEALRDVAALRRILFKDHPAPTAYVSRDSIERRLEALTISKEDTYDLRRWEWSIRDLLTIVGCGHTYMSTNPRIKPAKNPKVFPFRVFSTDGQVWVRQCLDSTQASSIPVGAELLQFNNYPVTDVLRRIQLHQPSDGYNQTLWHRLANKDIFFNFLHRKYFPTDSVLTVRWRGTDGEEHTSVVNAVPDNKLQYSPSAPRDTQIQILYSTGKGKQYFYVHPANPKVGVLRIASFKGKGNRLYRRAFRYMNRHDLEHLVIDVRDNLGGDFGSCVNLARYVVDSSFKMRLSRPVFRTWRHQPFMNHPKRLGSFFLFDIVNTNPRWIRHGRVHYKLKYRPRRKNHFDGPTYVLTNGFSFSASSLMAAYIQAKSDATIIGQETGGGARSNNGMQIPRFILPGSGIKLNIPQMNLDYRLGKDEGRGVIPDIMTKYSIQDILEQRDLEWEAVWKQIKSQPVKTQ